VSSSGHENPERFRAAAGGRQSEIGQEYVHTHNHTLLVLALEQLLCVYSGIRKLRAFTELEEYWMDQGRPPIYKGKTAVSCAGAMWINPA
jgi:hypothetical protein